MCTHECAHWGYLRQRDQHVQRSWDERGHREHKALEASEIVRQRARGSRAQSLVGHSNDSSLYRKSDGTWLRDFGETGDVICCEFSKDPSGYSVKSGLKGARIDLEWCDSSDERPCSTEACKHIASVFFHWKICILQAPKSTNLIGPHFQPGGSCLSPSFRWLLTTLGIPWVVDTSLKSLPLSSHSILLSVYVCVSPLLRTPVIGYRVHLNPVWPHFYLTNYICKDDFHNKITFLGSR